MVWEPRSLQPEITTEISGGGTAYHWQESPCLSGHLHPTVPAEGTQHPQGPQLPSTPAVLFVAIWQAIQKHGCMDYQTFLQILLSGHQIS